MCVRTNMAVKSWLRCTALFSSLICVIVAKYPGVGPPLAPGEQRILSPEFSKHVPAIQAVSKAVVVFNDKSAELTVIRDERYHVCFLTLLRPYWYYPHSESKADVLSITPIRRLPSFVVIGPFIQDLCRSDRAYWVDKSSPHGLDPTAPPKVPILDDEIDTISGYIRDKQKKSSDEDHRTSTKNFVELQKMAPAHDEPKPKTHYPVPTPKQLGIHVLAPAPRPMKPAYSVPTMRIPGQSQKGPPPVAPAPNLPYAVPNPVAPSETKVGYAVPQPMLSPKYKVPQNPKTEKSRGKRATSRNRRARGRRAAGDAHDTPDYFVYNVGYTVIRIPKRGALVNTPLDLHATNR